MCVSVGFGIQRAIRTRHIVICGQPCCTKLFHLIAQTARFSNKVT